MLKLFGIGFRPQADQKFPRKVIIISSTGAGQKNPGMCDPRWDTREGELSFEREEPDALCPLEFQIITAAH